MDLQSIFYMTVLLIIILYSVPSSALSYCYYDTFFGYKCNYYDTSSITSIGTIVGAVIGGIVGLMVLVGIIVAVCVACKKNVNRGLVVHPMQTTNTVVATNNTNIQYPQYNNQYNPYYQPNGIGYTQPQNIAYPPSIGAPVQTTNYQPYTGATQ